MGTRSAGRPPGGSFPRAGGSIRLKGVSAGSTPSPEPLRGKHVLITGGSHGIGRAVALRLAREGARLAVSGRDRKALEETAAAARAASGAPAFARPFDLADERALLDFVRAAREALGPLDVLINNAGFISRRAPISGMTSEEVAGTPAGNP